MQLTPNLKLKKPEASDAINVEDLNGNSDVLDAEVTKLVSTTDAGRMSAADKVKLNGIAAGAQVNPGAATTSAAGLMSAADKSKLDGVATGANNYTHPSSHPPSIITQDSSNRFVTDAEKAAWNAKAGTAVATGSANGLMPAADKAALNAATNAATASTLVKRDSAGRMKAAAPAAADDVAILNSLFAPPFAQTTGTGTAYTVTFSPAITEYKPGLRLTISFHLANGTSPTINVNGLGAKDIIRSNMTSPPAGFMRIWSIHTLVYNGTAFQLMGEGGEYGTAAASDVWAGKTIGTDNGLLTGTMPIRINWNEATAIDSTAAPHRLFLMPPKGYYDGVEGNSWVYRDDPNFIAANIRSGVNVFGLAGTLVEEEVFSAGNTIILSDPFTRSGYGPTPRLARSYKINRNGIYRITFSMSSHGNVAYGQIYKNDVPYGIMHGRANSDLGDYTQDLYFAKGDECALYLWTSDYSAAAGSGGVRFQTSNNPNPTLWNTGS
ncbi:hypothetical protein A7K91_01885 [Paenibacillus oryzae]|uniref:Uncharacterized protein n=1 Tax=Paenibacillus oryzae TaxID=1844972 RepID=A0A1A5Y9Z8_9BACL|nr:hypothetical protein [Paenibacillus oryzae]OBR62393.1 hypothetical protein A7K91_01885 [Paenibacillus oryzae]